jgi:hypothetical protein
VETVGEQSDELSNILARLGRVEREHSRLKRIGLGVLVLAGAVLLMGQARSSRTIEAEKFILNDAGGMPRARLEMEPTDRPTLVLLDPKGFPLVSLGAGEDPALNLCKGNCEKQVQIALTQDLVGVVLYAGGEGYNPARGEQGKLSGLRAAFGVVKGVPGLNLYGEDPTRAQASLDLEGGPRLFLSDLNGQVDLEKAAIDVSDFHGFRAVIGSTPLETPRTGEAHKTSAASIVLFGKDGKVLWSAP